MTASLPANQSVVAVNGVRIPALGLGTFRSEGAACVRAVAHALRTGYRHVDTARMYGNEEQVGEGLRESGVPRDEVFVTTKVWHDDIADGDLQRSAEASLRSLGLEQVDLLLIHWPNRSVPLSSSIRGLVDAKRRGFAPNIGVSNFTIAMVQEAQRLAGGELVANQCEYHPTLDQAKLLAACKANSMAFVSYAPLGKAKDTEHPVVSRIAAAHGRTGAQVVLRWHVQQEGVVAIPKSSDPARIEANFAVWDFTLSAQEMQDISALASRSGRMIQPAFAPAWD